MNLTRRGFFVAIILTPLLRHFKGKKILWKPHPDQVAFFKREDYLYSQISKKPLDVVSSREFRIPLTIKPGNNNG